MKHHISKELLQMACTCIVPVDLSGQATGADGTMFEDDRWRVHAVYQWIA
jgi:hypothetical protein